ncbi:MAG: DinB family protein [Gemmatimonadales bacterium]|nr:DinB family protein [Gemmatimonadales bacterium]
MNEILELFAYNAWAMRIIFDAVAAPQLSEELYVRDLKSSHGGIHGTLAHTVWAEHLWLTRWLGEPPPAVAQGKDLQDLAAVRTRFDRIEAERNDFLADLPETRLDETRIVHPTGGGEYAHTFRQMFRHLVNHSSYHRGQVVTFLRQLGKTPPSTDLILYYRR